MPTFVMLVPDNGKLIGIYSIVANDRETARLKIMSDLAPKPHRHAILEAWLADGQPIREMNVRNSMTRLIAPDGAA